MATIKALDGNWAVAEGVRLARPKVVAAYPITPQTPIVERVADFILDGSLPDARYIAVESEHSAISAVIGAALVGTRVFTASAGAGLALMHEVVGVASGNRLPVVMAIANRALPSPWSLQADHSDSMAERDTGWIQLYAENGQEALDLVLLSYRLAEEVRLPVMLCLDGFFLSHSTEAVSVPDNEEADAFLPPYVPGPLRLDPDEPMTINQLTSADIFTEIKYQHKEALDEALELLPKLGEEFGNHFGRSYGSIQAENCAGADVVVVSLGSTAGTARQVAQEMREQGKQVGTLKVTSFRPFPKQLVRDALKDAKSIAVMDRSWGLGSEGPLSLEVKAALYSLTNRPPVFNYIAGLGGRDLSAQTLEKAIMTSIRLGEQAHQEWSGPIWIDLREEME
ncbi:MAG: pyruvate ferredoxin oxidoreductase [Firmicutes bacterium]|jgi:pyruvate ferredoxin oxidoreductase alpha subunit|nr:pyruvate ferredoxin oxidoreductase [Bacillota bacterium]